MNFIRSECFWLLLPLCLWFMWRWRYQWQVGALGRIVDKHLLPYLDINKSGQTSKWAELLWFSFFLLAVIALAGPSFSYKQAPVFQSNEAIIWVQDLSNQVLVKDTQPDRLTRAKYLLTDILNDYPYQIGLVAFAKDQHVIMPVTQDKAIIHEALTWLSPDIMPMNGYQPSTGVLRAIELAKASHVENAVIILATSGPVDSSLKSAARQVYEAGFHLTVLGLGTLEGGPVPTQNGFQMDQDGSLVLSKLDNTLANVAKLGDGIFSTINASDETIAQMLLPLKGKASTTHQLEHSARIQEDHGYWLLWFMLPLLILLLSRNRFEVLIR